MHPILELPGLRLSTVLLSVATHEWMTAKGLATRQTELIQGMIVEKMSKSPLHAQITDRLFKLIFLAVGESARVRSGTRVGSSDSVPEPDVSMVAGMAKVFPPSG